MKTYLRMLRMIKPYLTQLVLAVVFMLVFSFMSIFSIGMISPFLKALFNKTDSGMVFELPGDEFTTPATQDRHIEEGSYDEAGVSHEGDHQRSVELAQQAAKPAATGEEDDAARRERYERLQAQFTGISSLKLKFSEWVTGTMLKGTKQEALLRICLMFFAAALIKNIACYLQEILMVYVGQAVIRDLRNQLYRKLTDMPLGFYHQHKAGELISRATNDVLIAQQTVGLSFTKLIRDPIFLIMYLSVALIISWKMTLMALVLMPASLSVIIKIGKRLRKLSHLQQEQMADLTSTLQETVYGIRVVKAFAMEDFENRKFMAQSQNLFKQVFRINYMMKMSSPLTEQMSMIVALFLLWFGGSKVFTGGIMAPDLFIVFLFMIFSMVRPIKSLGAVNNEIQAGMAAADRIFEVLDATPEVLDTNAGLKLDVARGEVEFKDVHFAYVKGEPVLRGVSLKVSPGEVVALVGSSGSGKSTMIDMIPGFYHPDQGQILIDGHNIPEWNPHSLRSKMGIVTQEVILFHDSIFNNIAYGLDDVSLDDVKAAAKAANADQFIARLPAGYDTVIGDRGLKLSGGQRQRLSIARAILKNPAVLLLDEATSALDTEAEQLVQEAIDRLVKDRTTIVIAHRLSTIQNVDRIYLLEEGEVVQVGTHDELLAAGGRYKELYTMQFQRG
ncbi:MAG: ABC transporter ATP-binding protein [Candidatus Krumholzibacteria bacterium]|nr:ABC transporter ATP-binding protein [Candidatus Krumholzibacteria bacterium]